jgi:hypothetical protein
MSTLLEQASLVMIPSGYKEDVVYSQIPTSGAGDLSFTRASNGTRVNSAGLVEVCPWNDVEYSEDFTNAFWDKTGTITANAGTAPNGTTTADELAAGTSNLIRKPMLTIAGQTYTGSVYIKSANAGQSASLRLNMSIGQSTPAVSIPITTTDEWQRFTATYTTTDTTTFFQIGEWSTLGYGPTNDILIWGAQFNIGSTAKPYFPTTDRLNVPRLTYQNGGGGCPSLLLEKQSTNELSYSEQFDNAAYTKSNVSITANATTSPDGTQNADKLIEDNTNNGHVVFRDPSGSNKTLSFYAKAAERTWVSVLSNNGNNTFFNLGNGTLGTVAATSSATITAVGDGWYRCTVYNTHPTYGFSIYLATGNNVVEYTGNGTSGVYIWGAQLEDSSYVTSYIPSTSSSATRVADFTSRSGLALTNFTFSVNFKPLDYIVELFDFQKTGGGRMFYVAVQSSGFITFNSVSGGTIGAIGSIIPKLQTCKLAFKLNASTSDLTVFINGSNIGTYTTDITTFGQFLGLQSFGYNPGTQIEQIAIFPSVLTDAECISLTTI